MMRADADRLCDVPAALKGAVSVGEDTADHEAFHTLVLSSDGEQSELTLTATEDDTSVVIVRAPLPRLLCLPAYSRRCSSDRLPASRSTSPCSSTAHS